MHIFISTVALFRLFFLCLSEFELGGFVLASSMWVKWQGEGSYPAGGVGYSQLARLFLLAARALCEFA
jgi:hypothetical protein